MSCDYDAATKLYLGHDNSIGIIPYSDVSEQVPFDMTAVTEVTAAADLASSVATGDSINASSTDVPVTILWSQKPDGEWVIFLRVGLFSGITAGKYLLRVVIFEPQYPNGLVIADDVPVTIEDIP